MFMNILKKKRYFDFDIVKKKNFSSNSSKRFCMFIFGMLISALAFNLFYSVNDIIPTGTTGLAFLLSDYLNIDTSVLVLAISSIILIFGFAMLGIDYGAKAIMGTILYPIFIKFTSLLVPFVKFEQASLFLLTLVGAVMYGFGFGLIKKSNYNSGGFSIIYDILHEYVHISVGMASIFSNVIILFAGVFIFGVSKMIYSFSALYISSCVMDKVILGTSKNKAFYIVTSKPLEVKSYIINNLSHTVTVVNARGGYSNKKRKMLMCVIPTIEYGMMKEVIKEIDKNAFFLVTDTYSVSK